MSNDKSEATYHGHLDPDHPTTDTIHISTGSAIVNGEPRVFQAQDVPLPKKPGSYDLELNVDNGEMRWTKLAEVTVKKPTSQLVAEFMGTAIGVAIVTAGLLIGLRYLIHWLWGI